MGKDADPARKGYEQAVLGQASMALLILMKTGNHPKFQEYQALATDKTKESPKDGFTEADRNLLMKAYDEEPIVALEAFLQVPEVIEILGIDLDDDSDDLPPLMF